jgi:hypothetical protein
VRISEFRVEDLGLKMYGVGLRVYCFRFWILGFIAYTMGCEGLGFRV